MKTNTNALVVLFLILLSFSTAFGQKKSNSNASGLGVGIRLGEPTGVTGKLYTGNIAIELSVGRSSYWGYDYYHHNRDRFYDKYGYYWHDYRYKNPISTQLHFLWHKPISQVDGLDWYAGVGSQIRFQTFTYYWDGGYRRSGRHTNVDLGADGVIGLEYTLKDIPLSIFLDATLFMEFVDNPFAFWGQGGVGIRYNLK
ncbi:MAG TPA: hypothetical protein VIK89_04110 [Cytophagaceae bacterium]